MAEATFEGLDQEFDRGDGAIEADYVSSSAMAVSQSMVSCPNCGSNIPVPGATAAIGSSSSTAVNLKMELGDLATSLEYELDSESELKFNSIKVLYLRKLKAIMAAVDEKDKEILKLKVMSKDNRRTQMIQALKGKIQEKELVIDVLKEELVKKKVCTSEEINTAIIKKTVGGPKRFRPLTREELENKVIELERQVARASSAIRSSDSIAESKHGSSSAINLNNNAAAGGEVRRPSSGSIADSRTKAKAAPAESKDAYRDNRDSKSSAGAPRQTVAIENNMKEIIDFGDLVEELTRLKAADAANKATIEKQRGEITDLRNRNALLAVQEDSEDFLNRELQEYKVFKDEMTAEMEALTRQLGACMEENMQLRAEIDVNFSDHRDELELSKEQCQRLLKQNGALLEQLSDLEAEMESRFGGFSGISSMVAKEGRVSTANGSGESGAAAQVKKLTAQLASSDAKALELDNEVSLCFIACYYENIFLVISIFN
jgi:hypothetical protein